MAARCASPAEPRCYATFADKKSKDGVELASRSPCDEERAQLEANPLAEAKKVLGAKPLP